MDTLPKSNRFKKGFTILELLIVMAILGVLASVFLLRYDSGQKQARDTRRRSDLKQYQTALEIFANRNNGTYPAGSNLVTMCNTLLGAGATCPDDPNPTMSGNYHYSGGGASYAIYALLEYKPGGVTQYFNILSDGRSCNHTAAGSCP